MDKDNAEDLSLDLNDLKAGTPGITPAFGEGLAQAASVCLEDQGHSSPASMTVRETRERKASVHWEATDDQMRRCWNDDEEATEHGAYGIAALVVPQTKDLHVVERSKKGTGFDYWLGSPDAPDLLFQNKARLEVSGIRTGSSSTISRRVKRKLEQTDKSAGKLPAVVVVVEFGTPETRIDERCQK